MNSLVLTPCTLQHRNKKESDFFADNTSLIIWYYKNYSIINILIHQRNANQNNSDIPSDTCKNGQDQKHSWQLMLERLWGKGNTPPLLVGVQAGTAPLDISMAISQKIWKQPSSRPSNTTFGYIPKGCSIIPQGHVLNDVHRSMVCHSQNLETT